MRARTSQNVAPQQYFTSSRPDCSSFSPSRCRSSFASRTPRASACRPSRSYWIGQQNELTLIAGPFLSNSRGPRSRARRALFPLPRLLRRAAPDEKASEARRGSHSFYSSEADGYSVRSLPLVFAGRTGERNYRRFFPPLWNWGNKDSEPPDRRSGHPTTRRAGELRPESCPSSGTEPDGSRKPAALAPEQPSTASARRTPTRSRPLRLRLRRENGPRRPLRLAAIPLLLELGPQGLEHP